MRNTNKNEIRIYVACLAAYNNDILHGAWIDANQDPYDIWEEVSAMLMASPITDAEEWAIHDYEGFEGYSISEYEKMARDLEINDVLTIKTTYDQVHVF